MISPHPIKLFVFIIYFTLFKGLANGQTIPSSLTSCADELATIMNTAEENGYSNAILQLNALIEKCESNLKGKSDSLLALIYHRKGVYHYIEKEFKQAIETYTHSLNIRKGANPPLLQGIGHSHLNLGKTFVELYLFHDAKAQFDSAVKFLTNVKEHELAGDNFLELAILHENLLDYEQGLIYAQKALEEYKSAPFSPEYQLYYLAIVHQNLGDLFGQLHQFNSSIYHYQIASKNYQSVGLSLDEAGCLNNLGVMYLKLGNNQKALGSLEKAAAIYKGQPPSLEQAKIFSNLGIRAKRIGRLENAEKLFNHSFSIYKQFISSNKHPEFAKIYDNLADVYQLKGNAQKALKLYHQAIQQIIPSFDAKDILASPSNIDTTFILGQKSELLTYFTSKAQALQSIAEKNSRPESYLEAALQNFRLADSLIFRMRSEHYTEGSKLFWLAETRPIYEQAIALCLRIGKLEQAFLFMEKSKAILLLEALEEAKSRRSTGIPDSLLIKEKHFKEALLISEIQLKSELESGNLMKMEYLRKNQNQLMIDFKQFSDELENQYPQYFAYKYQTSFADLKAVQNYLQTQARGTALLEYFEGDSSLYLMKIQANSSKIFRVTKNDSLIYAFQSLISKPILSQSDQYRKAAFSLAINLLPPNISVNGDSIKNLIIIPDGQISSIPFEALLTDSLKTNALNQLSFLIKKYRCSYSFSASILLQKEEIRKKSKWNILAIAPVEFDLLDRRLFRLGKSQTGIKSLAKRLEGKSLIGPNATRGHFKDQAKFAQILYFFTHASGKDKASAFPWIAFRDSLLLLPEIYGIETSAQMAVLGACETLVGDLKKGEGVMNFARAFRYIGVESIIATLWQAEEERALNILDHFFNSIKAGKRKDQALHEAKLAYLEEANQADQASPYYWAPFIQIGKSDELSLSSLTFFEKWWWIGLVLLGFIGLGGGRFIAWYRFQQRRD